MHWTQKGARKYLYRTFRDTEGKVRREYVGTGHKAELIFLEDQLRRAEEAKRCK
jgi:hypothetical protein